MPEGDTIFRAARTLGMRLSGKVVRRFESPLARLAEARLEGTRVVRVQARGKNLTIDFDDGRILATHMKMTGSWHVYRPGERWRLPGWRARVVIEVEDCVAVCFSAPVVELHGSAARLDRERLARLGPDILAAEFSMEAALERCRADPGKEIGEALLDQRVVCGIGNIYKSEALFLEGVSPWLKVAELDPTKVRSLVGRARTLMQRNTAPGSGMRTMRADGGHASRYSVYRRAGRPCLRCGGPIAMRRQGTALRSTYYCPSCQNVGGAARNEHDEARVHDACSDST